MFGLSALGISNKLQDLTVGLGFCETMSGTHILEAGKNKGAELPFSFTIEASTPCIAEALKWRQMALVLDIAGTVEAEGINNKSKLNGTLEIDILSGRRLVYDFEFRGKDRKTYSYHGEKHVSVFSPWRSMTTLAGETIQKTSGKRVSRGVVLFPFKQLLPFIASMRLWLDD